MNNLKRKASKRFKKIKELRKQRRKAAIANFVDNASTEMKIAIAKQMLGLQLHETIDDHPVYGMPLYAQERIIPSAAAFEYNYSSPCNKDI